MNENEILNRALNYIDTHGVSKAYAFLVNIKNKRQDVSSQFYNFLYCLAALDNKLDESLAYLEESIIEKGMWYRSDVFEDDDLDNIRNFDRFKQCFDISEKRYKEALQIAETKFTWTKKENDELVITLHGNQQNMKDSYEKWKFLQSKGYQVENIQSSEIDSFDIFRWDDEGTGDEQLIESINSISWDDYDTQILCGFSSGCNVILKTILNYDLKCTAIILQSPWIPVIDTYQNEIGNKLEEAGISVLIVCGKNDKDCFERSELLLKEIKGRNLRAAYNWIDGLEHDFPVNYKEIITGYLDEYLK